MFLRKKVNEESYMKLYPRPRREERWRDGGKGKDEKLRTDGRRRKKRAKWVG
jgi:hypothetical protein